MLSFRENEGGGSTIMCTVWGTTEMLLCIVLFVIWNHCVCVSG